MKLYTKGQLVLSVICTTAIVVAASSVIFLFVNKNSSQKVQNQIVEIKENPSQKNESSLNIGTDEKSTIPVSYGTTKYTQEEYQNINVYDLCNEAVVNINTKVTSYDWFLEPYVKDGGSGSGSIIDKNGYILTNVHVIQDATKIYISLYDGSQYEAEVVGQDLDSDLAVLKFNPPNDVTLKTISFGDSTALKVGQKVIAIGNPFGMERTMTTGIVSGLGRPIQNSNKRIIRNMIRTDASINPGNSGGPLLDTSGNMIGINTMIMSSSGSSSGVGFAVPSETAIRVVADLIKYGKVQRGTLEISFFQNSKRIAQYADLEFLLELLFLKLKKAEMQI